MTDENFKLYIKELYIENLKCFNDSFRLELNEGVNIIVGDNEAGKSTILEAIYLALTGTLNGRYLRNELTSYLFNVKAVKQWQDNLQEPDVDHTPPQILIEIFLGGSDVALFEGDGSQNQSGRQQGFSFKIAFDDKYADEYEALISSGEVKTLPVEYYNVSWQSFARDNSVTPKTIPLKPAFIDSSTHRYRSGSDIYIAQIISEYLEKEEEVAISQAHRKLKENFMTDEAIKKINEKIKNAAKISDRKIEISIDLSSKNAWENNLMTYLDDIPFQNIGKGEQTMIKTKLALAHKKSTDANILLLEEPENHLSHSHLNKLLADVRASTTEKQIIVTTHSSFVANKLGLSSLIFLHDQQETRLNNLSEDTRDFFSKLAGYNTLRLLLCKKAILVEGDSDELVVQKAYQKNHDGRLPIEDEIDVISVGTAFLRFLEIAKEIKKPVTAMTDNDGSVNAVKKKYKDYLGESETKNFIKICFDENIDTGEDIDGKPFNYNTLEPKLLKANSRDVLNNIFSTSYATDSELLKYMKNNKTECAIKIFKTEEKIELPDYISDAVKNRNE